MMPPASSMCTADRMGYHRGEAVGRKRAQTERRTAYAADRAASLAGVPRSTLHYWARTGLLVPSVSPERVKLWSFEDLIALRTIDWLRQGKVGLEGEPIPPTAMNKIRRAIRRVHELDLPLGDPTAYSVLVDREGKIYVSEDGHVESVDGQRIVDDSLDLLAPFGEGEVRGPDLRSPRPHLRIVPGKLAGEPHVEQTRLETRALAALHDRGYSAGEISELYPFVEESVIREALDLEMQLSTNLQAAA